MLVHARNKRASREARSETTRLVYTCIVCMYVCIYENSVFSFSFFIRCSLPQPKNKQKPTTHLFMSVFVCLCAILHSTQKANVKQSDLAKGLRESFARLDLQHQEKHRHHKNQEQERPKVVPIPPCDADAGEDEEEEGGRRTRPIDVETSMSVR